MTERHGYHPEMRHASPAAACGPTTAHILLAHGSQDPQWPAAVQAVAERIRRLDPRVRIRCAYLEWARPDLAAAIEELIAEGAQAIAVWPMFLGLGRHAREDLPRLIALAQAQIQTHSPSVTLTLQPAIAEHTSVLDAMAQVICSS